ncbi:MAG: GNAT family N-acetyltransferase [Chloroflexota bacterium]
MTDGPRVPGDQAVINLEGDLVALDPQRRDLQPLYQTWLNDVAVMAPLGAALRPVTSEAEDATYEQTSTNAQGVWFTVYERATPRPIGIAGLRDIDDRHRTAELVIFLGEKGCWGKGYGTETTRLILDFGFSVLGLENVMLRVYRFNERAIRAYRRAGFREIGRRREAFRLADRAYDVILMDYLATEFESPVLRRVFAGAAGATPESERR